MSREIKVGEVRCYEEPGNVSDDWRVVQEIGSDGVVKGGRVLRNEENQYYVEYLTYGTWVERLIGDLVMTWSQRELRRAVERGKKLRGR